MFRPAVMVKLYGIFHKSYKVEVLFRLQDLGLVQFFDVRTRYPYLESPRAPTREIMHKLDRIQRMLAATPSKKALSLLDTLLGPRMAPVSMVPRSTGVILSEIGRRLDELEAEFQSLKEGSVSKFIKTRRYELLVIAEQLRDALMRMRAYETFGATKETLTFGCWVQRRDALHVQRVLMRITNDSCAISVEEAGAEERVPIMLENPSILKPFEVLAESYGMPEYRGIDPTPILAVTFTLFFGLMFADIGYGMALVAIGIAVFLKTRRSNIVQRSLNLVIVYSGLSSILFGVLLGEFFGGVIRIESHFIRHGATEISELMELLMLLAISVGIVHISTSVVSRLVSVARTGGQMLYPVSIIAILWPTVFMALSRWEHMPQWSVILARFLLAAGLLSLFKAKGIEAFDELIALFANIVSYSRLAIISVLHVVVARLLLDWVYGLPRTLTGLVVGVVAFAAGAAIIFTMGVFITFIHSLRLHWLEFFKRFYSGIGERFKPFKAEREYTYVL